MPFQLFDIFLALPLFAFILFRIGGMMLTAPLFASAALPVRIRIAMAFSLAAMSFPMISRYAPTELTLTDAVTASVSEVLVGASIGLAATMVMMAADVAGMLVGQQGGLALGEVFDPMQNRRTTVVGQLYTAVLTFVFLIIGGHRQILFAVLDSYRAVPMQSFTLEEPVLVMLVEVLSASFIVAVRIAGPALIALFLTGTAMGFLSRTMPQFNILSVGFTLRVLIAIGTAGLALSACQEMLIDLVFNGIQGVRNAFALDAITRAGDVL